ncbi:2-dehydropantoate 2-reductase [Bartonella sp. HY406]|uniref:2-dehydropantoate 2-reductase n=1 Tax=Bartonella sp. HY406 TaxID=2979331 RepID=UPI0021C7E62E|nr:2-dehydropantoate 2-reductase [Bartonella sp. HY406]UXN03037.1 2-dehydropantoate 2-reductase [Bartonella sp. HY406]
MERPRILVLGAGGIGGYYGGRLAEIGGDVTFLVREKRQANIEQNGLVIASPAGNAIIKAKTILASELQPNYDFIFLTCKAYDLDDAIAAIAPAMGEGASLVPFLNGMAHMDRLNEIFGKANVLGGSVIIQATLGQDGVIHHLNNTATLVLGEQDGGLSERTEMLDSAFNGAKGLQVSAVPDILQRMWNKWVQLSAFAGMTCLMRASLGDINRAHGGREAMSRYIITNAEIAAHYGFAVNADAFDAIKHFLLDDQSVGTSSMLRDIEHGNRVEGDHILGDLLQRAEAANIKHPILELAYSHVKAYEERKKRETSPR